jgi:hypothetical protein
VPNETTQEDAKRSGANACSDVSERLEILYPITIDIKVRVKRGDQVGTMTQGGPTGRLPTHQEIMQAIADAKSIGEADGFSLPANPQELMELRAYEMYGMRVCIPTEEKSFCYSDDELPTPRKAVDDADSWEDEDDEWCED